MCGICAVLGVPSQKLLSIFESLLELSLARGHDSTGVAAIGQKNGYIIKDTALPIEIIKSKSYAENITRNLNNYNCYIGHCRSATKGTVSKKNAHPFQIDNIVMVHNGTLIKNIYNGDAKFETDSEGIAYSIAKYGPEYTWKNLDGAAALIWWDYKTSTLSILRNEKRPLHFAYLPKRKGIVVASEPYMIDCISRMLYLKEDMQVYFPRINNLFQFSIDKNTNKIKETSSALEEYKWAYTGFVGKGVVDDDNILPFVGSYRDGVDRISYNNKVTNLEINNNDDDPPYARDLMTETEFKNTYKECYFCRESLSTEYETAVILDEKDAVCEGCITVAVLENLSLVGIKGR